MHNSRAIMLAPFFFIISFLLFACGATRPPSLHPRPPGFWENGKATVQVLHTFRVASLDESGEIKIEQQVALGTGVVVNVNGMVLTNNHAVVNTEPSPNTTHVPGSDKIEVCLVEKGLRTCVEALVIDQDSGNDLALLMAIKIFEYAVTFVDDHSLQLGDEVYLWGNIHDWTPPSPMFGRFINRVETPYVTEEAFKPITLPLLLMDISFLQGSSGGPTFDQLGRCVGQNKFFTSSSGGRSIGISTPSTTMMAFLKKNKVLYKVKK